MAKTPKYVDLKGFLSYLILKELNRKKLCGDELAEIIGKKKGGKLTPGTIYPALKRLKKAKLVKLKQDGRKKHYFLTKKGKEELKITRKFVNKIFKN